jgi:hypothetical protein
MNIPTTDLLESNIQILKKYIVSNKIVKNIYDY